MPSIKKIFSISFIFIIACGVIPAQEKKIVNLEEPDITVKLPAPETKGTLSVEEALATRRSVRQYKNEPLTLKELGQILWAAQGITANWGGRTAPSAGATYPLEIYIVAGNVKSIEPAIYYYNVLTHSLKKVSSSQDIREKLAFAALGQQSIKQAPAVVVIAANFSRTERRYGDRARQYVFIEVGHAAENIYLQAESLGLATVAIGAFNDKMVKEILNIPQDILYLMPVGKK
ncbi:MAG TPA: SagB/ThcOx family dehydrogenase [bacterium]|nr:SagB/ThcOx family dehydrogenase [bacterium]HOL35549.1 SagB/ThcOx family dehydrogenase [bacterium]HPO52648.1 SagB/ThcOx family dehydrogenase [bacterium]